MMSTIPSFSFSTVPSIVAGSGESLRLAPLLKSRFPANNIHILTDAGIIKAGLVQPIFKALSSSGFRVTIDDTIRADPPEDIVLESIEAARSAGAELILGLGGGSSLDTAKLVAVLLKSQQPLNQVYGTDQIKGPRKTPLVLIPTTAGTGSEVTPISIVTTGKTTKSGVVAPQLYADLAILDPDLTLGLPKAVTAATGVDAMVHAIEAYTSRHKKNLLSDMLAREALALLYHNLPTVLEDPSNKTARMNMLLGSMLAGQAFANAPVAAVHALAYPLGGQFHVPHGLSNALVLPHVLRFNKSSAEMEYSQLCSIIAPSSSGSAVEKATKFIALMTELSHNVGLPTQLTEVGVKSKDIPTLVDDALLQTRLLKNNPKDLQRTDIQMIYEQAL